MTKIKKAFRLESFFSLNGDSNFDIPDNCHKRIVFKQPVKFKLTARKLQLEVCRSVAADNRNYLEYEKRKNKQHAYE